MYRSTKYEGRIENIFYIKKGKNTCQYADCYVYEKGQAHVFSFLPEIQKRSKKSFWVKLSDLSDWHIASIASLAHTHDNREEEATTRQEYIVRWMNVKKRKSFFLFIFQVRKIIEGIRCPDMKDTRTFK